MTPEEKSEYNRKRREQYALNKESISQRRKELYWQNRDRFLKMKRADYERNKEEYNAKDRERKKKDRKENKDAINEAQREYYARDKVANAEKANQRRIKREPWRGIKSLADAYTRGDQPLSGLVRLINERIALTNQANGSGEDLRRGDGEERRDPCDSGVSEVDRRIDETKD